MEFSYAKTTIGSKPYTALLIVLGATAVIYAAYASLPLAEPDETRYAEVAREMLETGDWLTPRLNYQTFLDKPPLLYWMTAAGFRLFGVSEAVARLPVMISAVVGLGATFVLANAMYGAATAVIALVILATSPLFFGMGQILTMDMLLTACTTVALCAGWRGCETGNRHWYRLAYAATGLGVLTKGPVAAVIVALPTVVLLLRRRERIPVALDVSGALLLGAIAVPWFLAVEAVNHGFLANFLFHQNVDRFLAPWEHREPLWFYAYVLPVALFPWGLLWLLDARRACSQRPPVPRPQLLYLASWAGSVVALFSLSRSKLIPYVLPALPPIAILLARVYEQLLAQEPDRLSRRASVCLAAGASLLALVAVAFFESRANLRLARLAPLLAAGSPVLLCGAWLLRRPGVRGAAAMVFGTLAAVMLGLLVVAEHGRDLVRSYARLGATAAAHARPGDELVIYGGYLAGVGFYARREAVVLRVDKIAQLGELWASPRPVLLVASRDRLPSLARITGATPTILAEADGKVLLTNARRVGMDESLSMISRNRRGATSRVPCCPPPGTRSNRACAAADRRATIPSAEATRRARRGRVGGHTPAR
jgi:4-amino-4-deoxy-L-arabinose transferase-like glycosyltransferase